MPQIDLQFDGQAISNQVTDYQGGTLGVIREFLVDVKNGRVAYALLDLCLASQIPSGKLFAIPWRALILDRHKGSFILNKKMCVIMENLRKL